MEDSMRINGPLLAPPPAANAAAQFDVVRTDACRVKRVIYPPGFRWSTHMKPTVLTLTTDRLYNKLKPCVMRF
jgi:hypothetical protein